MNILYGVGSGAQDCGGDGSDRGGGGIHAIWNNGGNTSSHFDSVSMEPVTFSIRHLISRFDSHFARHSMRHFGRWCSSEMPEGNAGAAADDADAEPGVQTCSIYCTSLLLAHQPRRMGCNRSTASVLPQAAHNTAGAGEHSSDEEVEGYNRTGPGQNQPPTKKQSPNSSNT